MKNNDAERKALVSVATRLDIMVLDTMTSIEIAKLIALHDRAERPNKEERRYWLDRIHSDKHV